MTQFTVANHGLSNGLQVTVVGQGTYFVILDSASTFRLSATSGGAAVLFGASAASFLILGSAKPISPPSTPGLHSFKQGIQGLDNGVTYYVSNVSGLTFQLKDHSGAVVDFNAGPAASSIKLGNLGLDLEKAAAGASMQSLYLDLKNSYTRPTGQALGAHTFGGPGGSGVSLSASSAPSGDGKSSATSYGGSGGIGAGSEIKSTFTSTPTVTAYIGATLVDAGGSVRITGTANRTCRPARTPAAAGLFQVGLVRSKETTSDANTTAYVGSGTTVKATNDVILFVNSNHKVNSTGDGPRRRRHLGERRRNVGQAHLQERRVPRRRREGSRQATRSASTPYSNAEGLQRRLRRVVGTWGRAQGAPTTPTTRAMPACTSPARRGRASARA